MNSLSIASEHWTPPSDLSLMLREQAELLAELERRRSTNKFAELYPDEGTLRRELYPKHLAFFAAGAEYRERAAIAANRIGKTWGLGAYEITCHATGLYPAWWEGKRFQTPTDIWVAGKTGQTTRDIVQKALTGVGGEKEEGTLGTGMIPKRLIYGEPTKTGRPPGAMDTISIRHVTGGFSHIGCKAYDQDRGKFEGTAKHVIWLDEEPPPAVYDECMMRLMDYRGLMLCTFTPLEGLSEIALRFLPHLVPDADAEDSYDPELVG